MKSFIVACVSAAVILYDRSVSALWVWSRCICAATRPCTTAAQRSHQTELWQSRFSSVWLALLHMALFTSTITGAIVCLRQDGIMLLVCLMFLWLEFICLGTD